MWEDMWVGLYTELFHAIITYLVSMLFADLLSLHLLTFLIFLFLLVIMTEVTPIV